jgi:hypothetical protein
VIPGFSFRLSTTDLGRTLAEIERGGGAPTRPGDSPCAANYQFLSPGRIPSLPWLASSVGCAPVTAMVISGAPDSFESAALPPSRRFHARQ